jgi:hypothetical protein
VAQERRLKVYERETRMRACKARIPRDGVLEQRRGSRVVLAIEPVHVLKADVIRRPRIEVLGHREARAVGLVQRNADFERSQHARANFRSHPMHSRRSAR